jgi:hypothetical protein
MCVALFLGSRRCWPTSALLVAVAAIAAAIGDAQVALPLHADQRAQLHVPILVFLPALSASVLSTALGSPIPELEGTASYPLWRARLVLLSLLAGLAAAGMAGAGLTWPGPEESALAARNALGFTGIAVACSVVLGARFGWIGVLAYAVIAFLEGAIDRGEFARWAWPLQPAWDAPSWIVALALLVAGGAAYVRFGVGGRPPSGGHPADRLGSWLR